MAEVCVSLARGRHAKLYESMEACARRGVQLIEVRLDYLKGDPRLREILEHRPCPLIATIRRRQEGGMWAGDETKRLQLLRAAIVEGFDYVDLEMDIAKQIPRHGQTRRIISFHDMNGMPADLVDLHRQLVKCDADVVKIAADADHPADNFKMFRLLDSVQVPTVAICMGDLGVASRVLGARFGSPFTYAAFSADRIVAPGMLTYAELMGTYRYESIDAQTQIYGVIGDPIAQSLSPLVHNDCFRKLGLNKVYVPFRVPSLCLDGFLSEMHVAQVQGLSVTIPHKTAIRQLGVAGDDLVGFTQAANTVVRTEDGFALYNTDGQAAVQALEAALPDTPGRGRLVDRTVLIVGAGGVARTIAYSLKRAGAIVTLTARKTEQAQRLAADVGCTALEWSTRNTKWNDILINCTPLGMYPDKLDQMAVHPSALQPGTLVFDTVYNPENTTLLKEALSRGCTVASGVEMFVRQAEAQFQLFTGQPPPPTRMGILVREVLSPARKMLREARRVAERQTQQPNP